MEEKWKLHRHKQFTKGYGIFPYVLLTFGYEFQVQVPIHFLEEGQEIDLSIHPGTQLKDVPNEILEQHRETQIFLLHDRMIEASYWIVEKLLSEGKSAIPDVCLVEARDRAYYYLKEKFEFFPHIPSGGNLVDQGYKLLAIDSEHFIEDLNPRK